jgi:large repetitive protein
MKRIFYILLFLLPALGFSQPYVTVDGTTYTHEQLIVDVLIDNPCAIVGNVTSVTGTNFGAGNGIGYFENTNPNFPLDNGIVLATGDITGVPGPNTNATFPGGGWPGDPQLFNYIQGLGIDPGLTSYNDATIMEFDFTPLNDSISFNFVFASNEYGTFQCSYSDAFAFFLENTITGEISNMALVPDTPTEVPISVTTIRNNAHNGSCASANPGYFSTYYGATGLPNATAPINLNGHTVLMQAWSYVEPNTLYRMKLVIADRNDSSWDSAVFIQGGSFFLGVNLGEDITIDNGNAVCSTEAIVIGLSGSDDLNITYQWYIFDEDLEDFVILPGETNSNLEITLSGTYQLEVTFENGCSATDEIFVEFVPQPIAGEPDDLIECDTFPNDGFAEFMLTEADDQVIDGQTDVVVMYFLTNELAEIGDPDDELISPFTNTVANNQTVFARLQETSGFGCYEIVELNLQVIPVPNIAFPITDYYLCDDDEDGQEIFDLTSKNNEILNGMINMWITYHNTLDDANNGENEILDPANYTSNAGGEIIYVRVENPVTGCYSVGQFGLFFHILPGYNPPTPFEQCDDDVPDGLTQFDLTIKIPQITSGNTNLSVSFYIDQPDAWNGVNPLPTNYTNISNPQEIWVRVRDINTGCIRVAPMDLIVNENPVLVQPDPLEVCDPDNDGFGEFNLNDATLIIGGGDPFLNITYHGTPANAINNVFPLPTIYNNTVAYIQTIYARATNVNTGCFSFISLELHVLNSPQIEDPSPLVLCDYNNNDTATFDLTLSEPEIFANIADPSAFTINYYQTQADADNGANAITDPTSYVNISNPQTIYIVVEDIDNGCQSQTTLQLQVVGLPDINFPFDRALCDVTNTGDETEAFNLNAFIPQITGGNTSLIVTFHESHPEAQSGDNALASPYNNIENPQNLWIRVEDSSTGCVLSTFDMTVTLTVNPLPTPEEPEPLEDCDPDNGGFGEFDLDSAIGQIAGGEPDLVITFHETFIDADMDMFALSSPYFNIVQDQQTVYVRVENEITGCHTVVELLLIVHPTPEVPLDIPDLVICSPDQVDVGIEFDLTLQTAIIYGDQDPELITLTFHETEVAALNGTPAIVTPEAYANTSNPQTIWVRLSIGDTGCEKVGSFELVVTTAPEIAQPEDLDPLELCDDEIIDGFTEFDLTVMIPDITLGAPEGMEVQFYESEEDAQNQNNQIDPDTAYTNIANPQIIWVRVYDADLDCDAYTRFTIRVLPNPNSNAPDPIELCDVDQNGEQEFDLTIRQAQIVGGEPGVFVYYYETLELAEEGDPTTAIPDPTSYVNIESPEQIIYVRVENELTGCYTIVELLIIVNPLPEMIITNYVNCELENDGTSVFDLTTKIAELIDNQEPGNYTVTFHEIEGDEQVPQNAIPPVQLPNYTNQSNPQTLWVYIENTDTGCFVTGSFDLIVIEGVTATLPFAPLEVCEDDLGSGEGTFDLTDLSEEILNGQTPPEYEITYHESEEDALAGINAITPPESYQSGGGIIWARVTRVDPDFGEECFEIIPIELQVNPLPIIADFLESYRLCVDADGNAIIEEFGMTSPPVIDTGLSTPDYFFIWEIDGQVQFGETQGSITATVGGVYTVTVIDAQTGCESQASTTVTVSSPPLIYSAQAATSAFAGVHAIEATAEGLGDYVFQLDDGPYQDVGFWDNVSPGTHIVTITDRNGCGSVEIEVTIIDYPLFFTPNNDGYHDTWNIVGISSIPTAKIYIFDRHGKLLKQISPVSSGWDGTFNGRAMPSSDYWFRVVYTEDEREKEFTGHFTLKR